jgi:glutamate/tyrosine decarboxylase-like PLP-dependent enzyme
MLDRDPLALDADEMRRIGYRTVDLLVERLLADGPAVVRATTDELYARIAGDPPEAPEGFDVALERLAADVLPYAMRNDHRGFLGFIPTSPTWPGALGDLIASASAIDASSWAIAAGPTAVEVEVLRWFASWVGYPEDASGVLVSGGSAANLTAIACAREIKAGTMSGDLVGYVGDQCHSSIPRAARALGFRPDQLRVVPTDTTYRMHPEAVARHIDRDLERGLRPLFVAANAGATNTGAIDPLPELADVCAARDVWFHVDGAYGGFTVLTERGRRALAGIELADSVTVDPHKWLYQPWECGALLVREGDRLRRAFAIVPDYLRETVPQEGETSFGDMGLQLSRTPRSFKVWLSIRTFGLQAFRDAIDRALDLAERLRDRVATHPVLEIVAPPSLSLTCVRRRFPDAADAETEDALNHALAAEVERSGHGLVTTTTLAGRTAIRLCVMNHATDAATLDAIVDLLATAQVSVDSAGGAVAATDRSSLAWAAPSPMPGAGVSPELLERLPSFADAPAEALERIAAVAIERTASPGDAVLERHDPGTDFHLILEGEVDVVKDGVAVNHHGPGEFFGELAALEWGAGYGYTRQASVVAVTPLRTVVLPERTLEYAMRLVPRLDREVAARFDELLPRS